MNKKQLMDNLKICVAEGTATAETFENVIKACGLTQEIIAELHHYYKEESVSFLAQEQIDRLEQ